MEGQESLVSQEPLVSYTDALGNVFHVIPSIAEEDVETEVDNVTPREFITDNMCTYGVNQVLLKLFNGRISRAPEFRNRLQQRKTLLERSLNPRVGPPLPPKIFEEKSKQLNEINNSLNMIEFHVQNSLKEIARIERELREIKNATNIDYIIALSKDYDKNVIQQIKIPNITFKDTVTKHVYLLENPPNDANIDENAVLNMIKITLNPEYSLTENINKFMKYKFMYNYYSILKHKYEEVTGIVPQRLHRKFENDTQKMENLHQKYKNLANQVSTEAQKDYSMLREQYERIEIERLEEEKRQLEERERQLEEQERLNKEQARLRKEREEQERLQKEREEQEREEQRLKNIAELLAGVEIDKARAQRKKEKEKARKEKENAQKVQKAANNAPPIILPGGASNVTVSPPVDVRLRQYADVLIGELGDFIQNESERRTCDIEYDASKKPIDVTPQTLLVQKYWDIIRNDIRRVLHLPDVCMASLEDIANAYNTATSDAAKEAVLTQIRLCVYARILQQLTYPCVDIKGFIQKLLTLTSDDFTKERFDELKIEFFKSSTIEQLAVYYIRHVVIIYQLHSLYFLLKHVKPGVTVVNIQFHDYKWNSKRKKSNYENLFVFFPNSPIDTYRTFLQRSMYLLHGRYFTITLQQNGTTVQKVIPVTPSPYIDIDEYIQDLNTYFTHIEELNTLKSTFPGELDNISSILYHNYKVKKDYYYRSNNMEYVFIDDDNTFFDIFINHMPNDKKPRKRRKEELKIQVHRLFERSAQNIYYFASPTVFIWFESRNSQRALYDLYQSGAIDTNFYKYIREIYSYTPESPYYRL